LIDQFLRSGNSGEGFIGAWFNEDRFETDSFRFVSVEPSETEVSLMNYREARKLKDKLVKLLPKSHKLKNRIREHGDTWQVRDVAKPTFTSKLMALVEAEDEYLMWVQLDAITLIAD
jgi:hypothetical protein